LLNNRFTRIEKRLREYEQTTDNERERIAAQEIISEWNRGLIPPVTFLQLDNDNRIKKVIRERIEP
jgi:hypothetical protein